MRQVTGVYHKYWFQIHFPVSAEALGTDDNDYPSAFCPFPRLGTMGEPGAHTNQHHNLELTMQSAVNTQLSN